MKNSLSTQEPRTATLWKPGSAQVAVIMISLNEDHNMDAVLNNIKGWAQEVFLVDSYSSDDTVNIALRHGVYVVQRRFRGFGDQWNFAINELPISAPWTMKLDPDERLTETLKSSICQEIVNDRATGISFQRQLWFMGRPLPITQDVIRIWRTGHCQFTDVSVNEHPVVQGTIAHASGYLEHHDSPDLHHWVDKQNRYTSIEALSRARNEAYAFPPKLFGGAFERRMWFKKHFRCIPFRYQLLLLWNLMQVQPWRSGRAGLAWARLRVWVRRMIEDKLLEMRATGEEIELPKQVLGTPNPNAHQSPS